MPVDLNQIKSFLEEKEFKYMSDVEKDVIIIAFGPNILLIKVEEEGEFVQIRTLNFWQYKKGKRKMAILELLGNLNNRRKLAKFGFDPEDGEISACIDIALEDNNLTSDQFHRCIAALLQALEEARFRLSSIMETGKDPGPELESSQIIELLEDLCDDQDIDNN